MLVYNNTKAQFVSDVLDNSIADKIMAQIRNKGLNAGSPNEFRAWENSMIYMNNIVNDCQIDDDVQIAIEYNIPLTSKRVDFIISGSDRNGKDNIVIVELKQWETAEVVDDEMKHSVRTFTGGAERIVSHPSYQAYSYSRVLANYSEEIASSDIALVPCAYLHNFTDANRTVLDNPIYDEWTSEAPFFIRSQAREFQNFVKKYISHKSSRGDLLYLIENGRIRPTKALQDSLSSMMAGNEEFVLLDEQIVCYDMCLKTMNQCLKDRKKRVIIIQGGPGTGKSVLAVNLLTSYIRESLNAAYVTKNSAPRNAFLKLLTSGNSKQRVNIQQLFRSPFGLSNCAANFYDCLIVDEAHRLVEKMYGDWGGQNQVKECIDASLLTIFMLDEDQSVTRKDIGSVAEVRKWANALGARVIMDANTRLISQFRCNGSDAYIQFIDDLLQINPESVKIDLGELNYDFRVFDSPSVLREALREKNAINNKSRMVAGYCYDWNVKNGRGDTDISLQDGFNAQWNLPNDDSWAVNPSSFEQVGCIHTAQGLEFDYVGVLIGRDLTFDEAAGRVVADKSQISKDDKSSGIRTAPEDVARRLILNTYKTLLTRGQKGCYVYCEDDALREYFKAKCQG
jgi:uncharacterized protein